MAIPGKLEVALGADRDVSMWGHTYTDLTALTQKHEIAVTDQGRQDRSSTQTSASRTTTTIENSTGLWTPGNASSTHFPDWDQGALTRYSVTGQTPYLLLPGIDGSFVSTADKATLDAVTGDNFGAIQWRGPAPTTRGTYDYDTSSFPRRLVLVSKQGNAADITFSLSLYDGYVYLRWSTDGTTTNEKFAGTTVQLPQPSAGSNTLGWYIDVSVGGAHTVDFYFARSAIADLRAAITADPNLVRLGDQWEGTGTTSWFASSSDLRIGDDSRYSASWGQVEAFEWRSGTHTGTVVANPTFTTQTVGAGSFADTAPTPNTWAFSGSAVIADHEPRQCAEIASIEPKWSGLGVATAASVEVTSQGVSRRLRQGEKAVDSSLTARMRAFYRESDPLIVGAWSYEDGETSKTIAPIGQGLDPINLSGTYSLGAQSTWPAVSSVMSVNPDDNVFQSVDLPAIPRVVGVSWSFSRLMHIGDPETSPTRTQLMAVDTNGRAATWRMFLDDTNWTVTATDADGTEFLTDTNPSIVTGDLSMTNRWVTWTLEVADNGANVDYRIVAALYLISSAGTALATGYVNTGSFAGDTGVATAFRNSLTGPPGGVQASYCWYTNTTTVKNSFYTDPAVYAWYGEKATNRIRRLCNENRVYCSVHSTNDDDSPTLGYQESGKTLTAHLEDAAAADGGILHEHRTEDGYHFRARATMYNQDPTLDVDQGLVDPFQPAADDAGRVNSSAVTRVGGSTYTDLDQPDIDKRGIYEDNPSLLLASDNQVAAQASWRVHLGTPDGMRVPSVTIELAKDQALIPVWIGTAIGDVVNCQNPPPWWPTSEITQLVEGYTETISKELWTLDLNTSPESTWNVAEVDVTRADTSGSVLHTAVSSSAMSLDVASTHQGARWRSAAGGAVFPFDLDVGGAGSMTGEEVTVSDIDDIPFTFGAVGTVTHGNNASVTPGAPAGVVVGSLLVIFAAIRNLGAGTVNVPTGWTRWPLFGADENVALLARIAESNGEAMPLVTFSGGVANADTSAQCARFGGSHHDVANLPVRWGRVGSLSSANIPYPGTQVPYDNSLVLYVGWRADDWTSVATIAGATEIGEPDTTTGDDQGIVWDYLIQTTPADIAAGEFVVTGGAANVAVGGVIVLTPDRQTFTVTRSANGVTKAQAAGAAVKLARPERSVVAL